MRRISNNRPTENIRAAVNRFSGKKWLMPAAYVAIAIFVLLVLVFIARSNSNNGPTAMVAPNGNGGMTQISPAKPNTAATTANAAPAATNSEANRPSGYPTDPSRNDATIIKDYVAHGGSSDTGAVDIGFAGNKNAAAAPIHATHDGFIKTLRDDNTYGNLVYVIGKDYTTIYGHLQSISVADGQTVKRGDNIGAMGSSGNVSSPTLDYQVWRCSGDAKASGTAARSCNNVNPADFLK